ncbi:MAG: DUF3990 domain-containing protein [Prevotella sp.]|uniref:DUF3990 domain-containing protein n=1 Tax=Prevotella sp. TaxID=59823 RepID=UPI0025EFDD3E|nr:DUF3990 domain-containing protein [uncultured Prevotella sp.]MED9898185.1 DUF3990 domain-containing protein [Prevotella sp.]
MRLFHGTNIDFKEIDFQKCKPNKDFGKGFYLTDIKQQALDMAVRRTKFSSCGSPIVQEYEFDESLLSSKELKVADDSVVYQINIFMLHFITIEELVKRLEYKKLNSQYFFGTEKAISKLKRIWH